MPVTGSINSVVWPLRPWPMWLSFLFMIMCHDSKQKYFYFFLAFCATTGFSYPCSWCFALLCFFFFFWGGLGGLWSIVLCTLLLLGLKFTLLSKYTFPNHPPRHTVSLHFSEKLSQWIYPMISLYFKFLVLELDSTLNLFSCHCFTFVILSFQSRPKPSEVRDCFIQGRHMSCKYWKWAIRNSVTEKYLQPVTCCTKFEIV